MDLHIHTDWIKKIILSCETPEQLDSSRVLISLFVSFMTKQSVMLSVIRDIEDDLLNCYVSRQALLII